MQGSYIALSPAEKSRLMEKSHRLIVAARKIEISDEEAEHSLTVTVYGFMQEVPKLEELRCMLEMDGEVLLAAEDVYFIEVRFGLYMEAAIGALTRIRNGG